MVEFMMHDKDSSGTIDSDECMEILFRRMGNDQVDGMVKEFMKQDIDGEMATQILCWAPAHSLHSRSNERASTSSALVALKA